MSNCPRCGATNRTGRSSCWNCWFPIPPEQPFPAERAEQQEATPPQPPVLLSPADPPAPALPAEEAMADDATRCETPAPCPPEATQQPEEPVPVQREFAYVAAPVIESERRGINRLFIVLLFVTTLLLTAILTWYFSFRGEEHPSTPEAVGQAYLSTLVSRDSGQRQQLADEKSKAVLFPSWFVVETAQLAGSSTVEGQHASIPVELQLMPAPDDSTADTQVLRVVFTRSYRVSLTLRNGHQGWGVDQHDLLRQLKKVLQKENPKVELPPWE